MKTVPPHPGRSRGLHRRIEGFTLPEQFLAMTVVVMVLGGVITTHLYGLRMFELVKLKLNTADQARLALTLLNEEIRSAYLIRVGEGSADSFTEAAINTPQTGSAIQIYPSSDTNRFIRYFWDEETHCLKRLDSGSGQVSIVAEAVSNAVVFSAEDFAGNIQTNNYNNRVIGLTLQFYQIQYPQTPIGPGGLYDFYQLKAKITRRTLF